MSDKPMRLWACRDDDGDFRIIPSNAEPVKDDNGLWRSKDSCYGTLVSHKGWGGVLEIEHLAPGGGPVELEVKQKLGDAMPSSCYKCGAGKVTREVRTYPDGSCSTDYFCGACGVTWDGEDELRRPVAKDALAELREAAKAVVENLEGAQPRRAPGHPYWKAFAALKAPSEKQ